MNKVQFAELDVAVLNVSDRLDKFFAVDLLVARGVPVLYIVNCLLQHSMSLCCSPPLLRSNGRYINYTGRAYGFLPIRSLLHRGSTTAQLNADKIQGMNNNNEAVQYWGV